MDLFQEKQNITSEVTRNNLHVKIQKCKDKKKAQTQHYIYIVFTTEGSLEVAFRKLV